MLSYKLLASTGINVKGECMHVLGSFLNLVMFGLGTLKLW